MLEIPESKTISLQAGEFLTGRGITDVIKPSSPHKFAFYKGDPSAYADIFKSKQIVSVKGHGMFVDICCESDTFLTISEGTNMRYYSPSEERPEKHQLMIILDDNSAIAFTVAMYGGIVAYKGSYDNPYYLASIKSISPLEAAFDENYFENLLKNTKDISAKALLATEQRIPGLGNGVLQDILFHAGIHPKRKKSAFSGTQTADLFHSVKTTLKKMTNQGGRDTEKDFYGHPGGYKTILSKNTVGKACPLCGDIILKEAYLGGAVYFCPTCQKI